MFSKLWITFKIAYSYFRLGGNLDFPANEPLNFISFIMNHYTNRRQRTFRSLLSYKFKFWQAPNNCFEAKDQSFTFCFADRIACHPSGLTKHLNDTYPILYNYRFAARIWSIRFGNAFGQQKNYWTWILPFVAVN